MAGASHSIYVLQPDMPLQILYEKTFGHGDWVTNMCIVQDVVFSAGMDGHVCKWVQKGTKYIGSKMALFQASISRLDVFGSCLVATSYDGTVGVYNQDLDLISSFKTGHSILDLIVHNNVIFVSDKAGIIHQFPKNDTIKAHVGPCGILLENSILYSFGYQDGYMRAFDVRLPRQKGRRIQNQLICQQGIYCFTATTNGFAIVTKQGNVVFIDSHQNSNTIQNHETGLKTVAYTIIHIEHQVVAIAWGNGDIELCDGTTKSKKTLKTGLNNAFRSLLFEKNTLFAVGDDGYLFSTHYQSFIQ
jgi:hypothetical protein